MYFGEIPVIPYQNAAYGVIKKQIKINCDTKEESVLLDEKIQDIEMVIIDQIKFIDKPNARKIKYKDVKKINIGVSKKDLISYRKKTKGAFYNCFVVIMRILWKFCKDLSNATSPPSISITKTLGSNLTMA